MWILCWLLSKCFSCIFKCIVKLQNSAQEAIFTIYEDGIVNIQCEDVYSQSCKEGTYYVHSYGTLTLENSQFGYFRESFIYYYVNSILNVQGDDVSYIILILSKIK